MSGNLSTAFAFLVNILFTLYTLAVMLRFLLQRVGADYYNPISQLVIRVTDPVLRPVHRVIPAWRNFDLAAVVLMLALQAANVALLLMIHGLAVPPAQLPYFASLKLISLFINLFFFTILIQVIVSWINPQGHNPVLRVLWILNRPLLAPIQRLLPPMGGFDLSPLIVLIGLQVINILLPLPPLLRGF
jgi:YggT family protein